MGIIYIRNELAKIDGPNATYIDVNLLGEMVFQLSSIDYSSAGIYTIIRYTGNFYGNTDLSNLTIIPPSGFAVSQKNLDQAAKEITISLVTA